MENLIEPVDRSLLTAELTPARFVKNTRNGNNQIFIVDAFNAPSVLREIGRLRELTFRMAGGGTGHSVDIDEFDTMEDPFQQLLVWDPQEQQIIGGYRFLHGGTSRIGGEGQAFTPTAELFRFSERFMKEYWPKTIELGRSYVQPEYQPMNNLRKGMFALDNIWDGLGAIIMLNPDVEYYFGKITMYLHFDRFARDLILFFMHKYFPDPDRLVYPVEPLSYSHDPALLAEALPGGSYDDDYRILVQEVRKRNENIPPLVNAYMNLSSTMKTFGAALNPGFGAVEEIAILVTIGDIFEAKKERHLTIQ